MACFIVLHAITITPTKYTQRCIECIINTNWDMVNICKISQLLHNLRVICLFSNSNFTHMSATASVEQQNFIFCHSNSNSQQEDVPWHPERPINLNSTGISCTCEKYTFQTQIWLCKRLFSSISESDRASPCAVKEPKHHHILQE